VEWMNRFVTVMNVISSRPSDGVGVTEIAIDTGLSKGTLYRMLQSMVKHQLITQVSNTKKYRLGPLAMVWGSKFILGQDISGLLSEYCDALAKQTKLYTYLCRYEAGQVYCIYTHQPEQGRQKYFVHVGQRMPLHCSASTKAILAFQPACEVGKLIAQENKHAFTSATIIDIQDWWQEVAEVQKTRIAHCIEELEPGVSAISTPLFGNSDQAFFSLSLVGNADYISVNRVELEKELLNMGNKASDHLKAASQLVSVN